MRFHNTKESAVLSGGIRKMQISRHWRMNAQRYRLQGVRYENGETSLQNRPAPITVTESPAHKKPAKTKPAA